MLTRIWSALRTVTHRTTVDPQQPLISVILTSYNHEEFVIESLQSVLDQTYTNIEVIVVDDCSTDGSVKKLKKIKDYRVKIIALSENRRFHPRNTALKQARGTYVAFQNSDDVWAKDKLEKQLAYMEKHPTTGAIFVKPMIIDGKGKETTKTWAEGLFVDENKKRRDWLWHFFMKGNCLCVSSVLVRMDTLKQIGSFNEGLVQLSDYELWIRIVAVADLHILSEPLIKMRIVGQENASAPSPESQNRSILEQALVYWLYAQSPILKQIKSFLPPIGLHSATSEELILRGRLIKKCWEISSIPHLLFAHQLTSHIFNVSEKKERLLSIFGVTFMKQFIKAKSIISISTL